MRLLSRLPGRPYAVAALLCLASAGTARADVVVTADGLVLEGDAVKAADGSVTVTTDAGETTLASDRVLSVEPGAFPRRALEARAKALAADDAAGWYRLALEAETQGFADLARRAYEAVVAADPDHAAARRALGEERVDGRWVDGDTARRRRGLVLYGGAWLLPAEVEARVKSAAPTVSVPADDPATRSAIRTLAGDDPVLTAAARLALVHVPKERRVRAALATLYDRDPHVRLASARLLGEIGDEVALRPLIFSGARDLDADVRRAAVVAAQSFGNDDTAVPFVRALGSESPHLVGNAAEALATLGDTRALGYVVKRISGHGGSARSYVAFLNQISYVRDYDVEIAQASNIANPDVATITEGVVLDVRVIDAAYEHTWVEPILVDTAASLAGRRFSGAADVMAWWAENQGRYPGFPDDAPGTHARPPVRAPRAP